MKIHTRVERVAERLVYSRFFDTHARDRSANGVDGLLAALHNSTSAYTPQQRHKCQPSSSSREQERAT
jgi:hypothetical protein